MKNERDNELNQLNPNHFLESILLGKFYLAPYARAGGGMLLSFLPNLFPPQKKKAFPLFYHSLSSNLNHKL